jgi:hypothetical protein
VHAAAECCLMGLTYSFCTTQKLAASSRILLLPQSAPAGSATAVSCFLPKPTLLACCCTLCCAGRAGQGS